MLHMYSINITRKFDVHYKARSWKKNNLRMYLLLFKYDIVINEF